MSAPLPEEVQVQDVDLYVGLSGETIPVVKQVDAFYWRCQVCGWLGTGLHSVESAQREGVVHYRQQHGPEVIFVERKDVGR